MSKSSARSGNQPAENGAAISVCVLAMSRPGEIARCLKSVRKLADEIILVDTGQDPDVPVLALKHGATLVRREWREDFSELRNAAIAAATGDWIFSLDADEWIQPKTVTAIRKAVRSGAAEGWQLAVHNVVDAPEMNECFLRRSCRLFRRLPGVRFERKVCETVENSICRINGRILPLEGAEVYHDGYRWALTEEHSEVFLKIRLLEQAVEADPGDAEQHYNLGSEYFALGDFQKAQEYLELACMQVNPEADYAPMAYSLLVVSLRELGMPEEGIKTALWAEKIGLQCAELSFARAWAHMAMMEFADAAYHFEVALKLSKLPTSARAASDPTIKRYRGAMGLALALVESGLADEALPHAQAAVKGCPERPEPLVLLACVRQFCGDTAGAISALEKSLKLNPYHPDALAMAISLYQEIGQHDKALAMIERSLVNQPDNPELLIRRASANLALGEYQNASSDALRATVLAPDSVDIQVDAGRVLAGCSDYPKALACFQAAIRLKPSDANAYFNAGDVMFKIGAFADAAEVYAIALQLQPKNAAGFFALGNALVKCGYLEAAITNWEIALKLKPDYDEVRHNLAIARSALAKAA